MDKIAPDSPETQSVNIVSENMEKLKAMFPEAFTEGKVDFDVLRQLLGDAVNDSEEKYGLNWHGKRRARQLALTPSTGTLRPCPEDSVDWDATRNLMIEGDNLEVLKLLQKSYAGKVKLIYIDPPYNTGKDFVYPDNYRDSIRNYLELTEQADKQGRKLSSNVKTSGRFHSNWMNMIYPRLKIARDLLSLDGALLCHIDENEQAGLEKIIEEIFGQESLLGMIVWDKRNPKGDAKGIAYQHEALLLVARDKSAFTSSTSLKREKPNAQSILAKANELLSKLGQTAVPVELKKCAKRFNLPNELLDKHKKQIDLAEVNKQFAYWIKNQSFSVGEAAYNKIDQNGDVFRLVSMAWPNKEKAPEDYFVPLKHPETGLDCPVPKRGWRNPPATMQKLEENGEIVFGKDHTTQPQRKYLLKSNLNENFPSIIRFGGSDDALLESLGIPFETPKPVDLARSLVESITSHKNVIVDFFAGSGSVGHAVMLQNMLDGSERKYILVQLPEPFDDANASTESEVEFCDSLNKPRNISEITKERLRRAAKKIKDENPGYEGDLGFRVFKLDKSNIRAWDPAPDNLEDALHAAMDHIRPGRTEQDILYELLLKLGIDLCVPIKTQVIVGKTVHSVNGGTLIACLDESITSEDAEPLAAGIADLHAGIKHDGETTVVFRDSAFADDIAKTNVVAVLNQRGITNIRSL